MDQDIAAPPAALAWLQAREGEMLALLETLVNSDSPSRDKPAVDAIGEILKSFFAAHDIPVSTEPSLIA